MSSKLSNTKQLRQMVVKILKSSTVDGLPNLIKNEKTTLKIMWTLFILLSTGLCSYLIIKNVTSYFTFDVVTKIRELNEFPSTFPTISICNANYFTTDYAVEFLKEVGVEQNLPDIFNDTVVEELTANGSLTSTGSLYYLNGIASTYKLNETAKKALGYDLNEFVLSCQFVYTNCNLSHFVWFVHQIYGNCFKFNSGFDAEGNSIPLLTVSRSNNFESLDLNLFSGIPKKLEPISALGNRGMVVLIHNSSTSPLTAVNALYISGEFGKIFKSKTISNSRPLKNNDF